MYPSSRKRAPGSSSGSSNSYGHSQGNNSAPDSPFAKKKKTCPFTAAKAETIDYKDIENLRLFITERGKILPRRITGTSARFQRKLSRQVKIARVLALLPYVKN